MSQKLFTEYASAARKWIKKWLLILFALFLSYLIIKISVAYFYKHSSGEVLGNLQQVASSGWICKTWEGEMLKNIVNNVTVSEKFQFTVRDDVIAEQMKNLIGKNVVLSYHEYKGVPSCFGDTGFIAHSVRVVETK